MARELDRPLTRQQLNRMLVANALTKPWPNVVLPAGLAVATIVAGLPVLLMIAIAVLTWLGLAAVTYFDTDEADRVVGAARAARREHLAASEQPLDVMSLGPPIAERLLAVRSQEARIRDAIDRAELPFTEVSQEVDVFVRAAERAAARAQLLYEYLDDQDRPSVERRLRELCGAARGPLPPPERRRAADPARQELVDALSAQLHALDRAQAKLEAFHVEMERIAVELGNVRGQLLSVSATTEAAAQRQLAANVRDLREQVGAVAEGMNEVLAEDSLGA